MTRALPPLLLAACAAAIFSCCRVPAGDAAAGKPASSVRTPESPEAVYKKGIAYLVTSQNPNGSWGSFESARPGEVWLGTTASHSAFGDATSALCVMALLAPSRDNADAAKSLEKGIRYLAKAPHVLRATGDTLYNTWTHIYVLDAMCGVMRDERFKKLHSDAKKVALRQIQALEKLQGAEGGWGYYDFSFASSHPTGSESCSFMTAAVLLALESAKTAELDVPARMVEDGLRSLSGMRMEDGAYMYGVYTRLQPKKLYNRINGSLGRSQSCNLALLHYKAGGVTLADLKLGLENLFKNHHFIEMGKGRPRPHESWYYTAGYYFFYGHYYAARCARELPLDERKKFNEQLTAVMCRLQDPDGSWWDFPLYGYYKAYGTAFALMTMELAKE